jgi:hypothetical protein
MRSEERRRKFLHSGKTKCASHSPLHIRQHSHCQLFENRFDEKYTSQYTQPAIFAPKNKLEFGPSTCLNQLILESLLLFTKMLKQYFFFFRKERRVSQKLGKTGIAGGLALKGDKSNHIVRLFKIFISKLFITIFSAGN